jgi:hypothetical protein
VDPDPYWESGSGSRARKLRNFSGKNALFSYFKKKILPLKRYNYFLNKKVDEDFKKICERN